MNFRFFNRKNNKPLELVFFISTGRCGTMHLSKCLHAKNAIVCHEFEPKNTNKVVTEKLVPISVSGNMKEMEDYFYRSKIPSIRKLLGRGKHLFIDTGHQINFGQLPIILNSPFKNKYVRLRRNIFDTAKSFLSTDPKYDIWNRTPKQDYYRWTLDPMFKTCPTGAIVEFWEELTRIQKVLWALNEVENIWKYIMQEYNIDFIEVETETLKEVGYKHICEFLEVQIKREEIDIHYNSSKRIGRELPIIERHQLEEEWVRLQEILQNIRPNFDIYKPKIYDNKYS